MTRHEIILEKLIAVSDKEWLVVMEKCREHIKLRIKNRTLTGAHSESELKMSAYEYYFSCAVQKLYEPEGWDWKFEEYTLAEQIIRIINSMISEQVRKYKVQKKSDFSIKYTDDDKELDFDRTTLTNEEVLEKEEIINDFLTLVEGAISCDNELEDLYLCLMEGKSYDEIAVELKVTKTKIYKLAEKLKNKVKKHAATKKI